MLSSSCSCLMPHRQQSRRQRRASAAAAVLAISVSVSTSPVAVKAQHVLLDQEIGVLDSNADNDTANHHSSPSELYNDKTRAETTVAKWRLLLETSSSSSSSSTSSSSSSQSHHKKYYDRSKLRPLDLVIDYDYSADYDYATAENNGGDAAGSSVRHSPPPPRGYQKGNGGFLEPYDFINYQYGNNVSGSSGDENGSNHNKRGGNIISLGVVHFSEFADAHSGELMDSSSSSSVGTGMDLEEVEGGGDINTHHKSSSRIGLTNFDLYRGIGGGGTGGKGHVHFQDEQRQRALLGGSSNNNSSLRGQAGQHLDNDANVNDDDEGYHNRQLLSSHHEKAHDRMHDASITTSQAEKFAAITDTSSSSSSTSSAYFNSRTEDNTPPVIRSTFPPANTAIGSHQTFGALISDGTSGSGIESACVQFKDHVNFRTACLELSHVGGDDTNSDIWEQTFDGFEAFHGKTWKYRVQSFDARKNRRITRWQAFTIDASPTTTDTPVEITTTTTTTTTTTSATTSSATTASTTSATVFKLMKEVRDENWPYDGIVENAVGRILFFFDSNFFVCSGTVVKDNTSDRTIVLTAAHCAYQASSTGGRFAEHALFIPDQGDTTAGVSNEICSDDPLGCWLPAFAVVHYEWTTKTFPESVPWDYAYYVIPNDPSVHLTGFLHKEKPELSKILDELVEPLPVDFNWMYNSRNVYSNSRPVGEFAHGLGYSIDRDPSFRYCATNMGTKFGISTYENLWLSACEMSGGSSGGPWLKDTTSDGRGTIISLNSWGYASVSGMGGPNFATASGSKAECLFEVAKSTPLDAGQNGIVVDSCG